MNDSIIPWGESRNLQIISTWVFVKTCASEGVVCSGPPSESLIEEALQLYCIFSRGLIPHGLIPLVNGLK